MFPEFFSVSDVSLDVPGNYFNVPEVELLRVEEVSLV